MMLMLILILMLLQILTDIFDTVVLMVLPSLVVYKAMARAVVAAQ